jgi:hypothetical protein
LGGRFINASGALRGEGVNVRLELEVMFGIEADSVIPGRCEASNPESRDSPMCIAHLRSGPADHPGMTALNRIGFLKN